MKNNVKIFVCLLLSTGLMITLPNLIKADTKLDSMGRNPARVFT